MVLQVPEFQRFVNLIASTGETEQQTLRVYGELVKTRTFHFVVDGKTDIRGLFQRRSDVRPFGRDIARVTS